MLKITYPVAFLLFCLWGLFQRKPLGNPVTIDSFHPQWLTLHAWVLRRTCLFTKGVRIKFSYFSDESEYLFFFWPPCSMWSSQTKDQISATVTTYPAAAAIPLNPLTHCVAQGIKPASWHCRDVTDPIASQQELWEGLSQTNSFKYSFKGTLSLIWSVFIYHED